MSMFLRPILTVFSRFNSALAAVRRSTLDGVYDTHTNMMFLPTIMQPTHARWEQVPSASAMSDENALTDGLANGNHKLTNGTNGSAAHLSDDFDTAMETEEIPRASEVPPQTSIFSDVPRPISRNFAVIDTHYVARPHHTTGYPGPDGAIMDAASGSNGLSSIPDDIADELPEDCRRAFEEAKRMEMSWGKQWGTEARSALRGDLRIGFNGYPV